ncbi:MULTISPECIES: DUF6658 family protein [unclassified Coleofasciculus]|uniref:DUF6658 family protein n=1 Tax=unclassified Coleofasciculus TaxID=2692782 RepID=UPI00187ECF6F|nr:MULTISPECIES: DUF6658 family protein [unclassified Coleofasciculus]MBE9125841.1 hypothetical protein [Coleofasciculus sp. LEGE 07081]MBE9149159.1 hypothetical protein [Coleofasciculus sp. LEGE 07092]
MNRVITWFQSIRWVRLVTVFIAGMFVFVSTACGGQKVSAKTADQVREDVPGSALTSPYKGGMNNYSDVDPRMNTSDTQAKTKSLINRVEKNLQKDKYEDAPSVGKQAQKAAGNIRDAAQNRAEDISKGTQRGIENIKGNTADTAEDAGKFAKRSAEDVKDSAQRTSREAAKSTKRAAEDVSDTVQDKAEEAAKSAKRAVND